MSPQRVTYFWLSGENSPSNQESAWNRPDGQSYEVEPDQGVGDHTRDGQHPYGESNCCRLQQTTHVKNDAHTAHAFDHVDGEGPSVGSIKIHTVPKAAHA